MAEGGPPSVFEMPLTRDKYYDPADFQNEETIDFVCIPADLTKPLRRCVMPSTPDFGGPAVGDLLPSYLKAYFADGVSIDPNLLQKTASLTLAEGDLKVMKERDISARMLESVAGKGSVETFPVVHPDDMNQYTGVMFHFDEVGQLKRLPTNSRASSLCENCGFTPAPEFFGDVFVGRVGTRPKTKNVDFELKDADSSAEWQKRAVGENLAWHQAMEAAVPKKAVDGTNGNEKVEDGGYSWTQTGDEVEVVFPIVPKGTAIVTSKVKVSFMPQSLTVKYDGEEKLKLKLHSKVDVDGCAWTKEGEKLVMSLEKLDSGKNWARIADTI